jgi:hypothetical protein
MRELPGIDLLASQARKTTHSFWTRQGSRSKWIAQKPGPYPISRREIAMLVSDSSELSQKAHGACVAEHRDAHPGHLYCDGPGT